MRKKKVIVWICVLGGIMAHSVRARTPYKYTDIPFYRDLHARWFAQKKQQPDEEALSVYRRYADTVTGGILEPMCGAGRHLIPFAQAGYDIEGFDASSAMLQACNAACAQAQVTPYIWHAHLEQLYRDRSYGCIFITGGSFGFLVSDEAVHQALERIYAHLSPGGICILSAEMPQIAAIAEHEPKHVWKGDVLTQQDGSRIIKSYLHLPLDGNILPIILRYDLERDGHIVQSEVEHIALRTYTPEELCGKLYHAGFTSVAVCKAYDPERAPDCGDTRAMYICKKEVYG